MHSFKGTQFQQVVNITWFAKTGYARLFVRSTGIFGRDFWKNHPYLEIGLTHAPEIEISKIVWINFPGFANKG